MTAAAIMFVMGAGHLVLGMRMLASAHRSDDGSAVATAGSAAASAPLTPKDWVAICAAWLISAVAFALATGMPWASAGAAVATAVAASALLASRSRLAATTGFALTIVAIALAVLLDTSGVAEQSPVARLLAEGQLATTISPSVLVLAASALLFLGPTSNALVRAVFSAARGTDERDTPAPAEQESWQLLRRGRELAVVRRPESASVSSGFRGGRIVGPLERALVFASLLAGMPVVIAGLVAAKGVVRFPEISADRVGGTKAEEFLVGTLCSFLLASLAVLTVVVRPG